MADDPILFRARADAESALAAGSTLDNVCDRALRSAKAWNEMADRAEGVARQRERREAETAARVAATRVEPAETTAD